MFLLIKFLIQNVQSIALNHFSKKSPSQEKNRELNIGQFLLSKKFNIDFRENFYTVNIAQRSTSSPVSILSQ